MAKTSERRFKGAYPWSYARFDISVRAEKSFRLKNLERNNLNRSKIRKIR